jgi:hypothetical protein
VHEQAFSPELHWQIPFGRVGIREYINHGVIISTRGGERMCCRSGFGHTASLISGEMRDKS